MSEFKREDRYIVIKYTDLDRLPVAERRAASGFLRRLHESMFRAGAPARQSVVVESDWPEYHLVWAMLEHRMAGKPVPDFNAWRRADELQLRLNAADQRLDELTALLANPIFEDGPVKWGAPKTVRQLIHQLSTLDPELETFAMLRVPDFKDGNQVRAIPLSVSYERVDGQWLSDFKGDGRKVLAFWSKPDPRPAPAKIIYPDVSTWPEWANWIGLDATGYWVFYENKPETTEAGRLPQGGRWGRPRFAEPQRGWAEMIYERPVQLVCS